MCKHELHQLAIYRVLDVNLIKKKELTEIQSYTCISNEIEPANLGFFKTVLVMHSIKIFSE